MLPPTNRRSDSTTTPTPFRCSPRCWTATLPRPRRLRGLSSAIRHSSGVRALHRAERQLERDHMAVAERAARRGISARVARRDRSAPLLSGGRRYVFKIRLDRTDTGLIRGLRAHRHRGSHRRRPRRSVERRRHAGFTAGNANPGIGNYADPGARWRTPMTDWKCARPSRRACGR